VKIIKVKNKKNIKYLNKNLEIPLNFKNNKLKDISNVTRLAGYEYTNLWETTNNLDSIISLRGRNILNVNSLNLDEYDRISHELSNKLIRSKLFKNDLVFPCVGTVGKVYLVKENNKYHINQNIAKITPTKINPLYLSYFMISKKVKQQISFYDQGAGRGNILVGDLREFNIFYPNDINQQEKIAQVLSQQEEQVNNIQKLIEKLEKRNQYYAERLLSGELRVREGEEGNIEFYENDSKITFELNKKTIKNCFNNKNIETWQISKFKDFIKEREKSKISVKEATNTGEYPFFNCSSSLTYTHNTFNYKEESLILSTGGLPSVHYYNKPFANSSDTYVVYSEKVDNKYLYYYLKHNLKRLESCFQGSGLKHLNKKLFKLEKLYLPLKIKEQKRIAKVLDKLNNESNNLKLLLEKEQKRFEWLSDALLSGEYQIVD